MLRYISREFKYFFEGYTYDDRQKVLNVVLFLVFFLVLQHGFACEFIGFKYYSQKLMLIYCFLFFAVDRNWKLLFRYYNPLALDRGSLKLTMGLLVGILVICMLASLLVVVLHIKLSVSFIALMTDRFVSLVSPLLEEMFFTGIVFNTLWQSFTNALATEERKIDTTMLMPFLLTAYWFLLGREYPTAFFNPQLSVSERILSFPGGILLWLLCSVYLFIKTRSLLPGTFLHYCANAIVQFYIMNEPQVNRMIYAWLHLE